MTKEERLKAATEYAEKMNGLGAPESNADAFLAGAEAEAESKWVSIKDRLPDHSEEFNCVQKLDEAMPVSTCMDFEFVSKKWYYPGSSIEAKGITHWQPLPQPPINQK